MEGGCGGRVRVLSRRMVRPLTPAATADTDGCHHTKGEEVEVIHLTPWDLRLISIDYIQEGILLPKPPTGGDSLVNALASSFSRALERFYSFAGRLAADERKDGTVALSLRCTGEGAEFVHAVAPDVAVADIVASLYIPKVVWEFYPLQEVLGADAALEHLPLVSVQVTELADGLFIGMSLNHSAGDGTAFWHFFNTWSEIHRRGDDIVSDELLSTPPPTPWRWFGEGGPAGLDDVVSVDSGEIEEKGLGWTARLVNDEKVGCFLTSSINKLLELGAQLWRDICSYLCNKRCDISVSTPPPFLKRWFHDNIPVPIPLQFYKLEYIVERFENSEKVCFFTFSTASVEKLEKQANNEMASTATETISSLQAVLAHLWRAVCRARQLPPEQSSFYTVGIGCRGRLDGIPQDYAGNAMVFGKARSTAGEIQKMGLGFTAWLLNRAVASVDEASMRQSHLDWIANVPDFAYMTRLSSHGKALVTAISPDSDVFGNDFGWGKPVAVRSGRGNKVDGNVTVFEGPEHGGGSISLEVCVAPDALARLIDDQEFMEAVSVPA